MVEKKPDMPRNPIEGGPKPKKPAFSSAAAKKPEGEGVFVGTGEPAEKPQAAREKPQKPTEAEKPILPAEKGLPLKLKTAPPETVFQQALKHAPEFAKVLGTKPIESEPLKNLLAQSIIEGDSLRETALKIKEARITGKISAGEADFLLTRISNVIGEPIVVDISRGARAPFFDRSRPGSATSRRTQTELQKIQEVFNRDPSLMDDPRFLDQTARDLAESKLPVQEVDPYIKKLRQLEAAAQQAIERQHRRLSSIEVAPGERTGLRDNPDWTVEEVLRRVEETTVLFPDAPAARAAARRLEIMSEYFSHRQYELDIEDYIKERGWAPTSSEAREYRVRATTKYRELSQKISIRTSIHRAYGIIRGVGNPESIWESLITVGEAGLEHLMNENGGLNEIVFNRYVQIFKHRRYNPDGTIRRITGEELYLIRKEVEKAVIRDRALYNELYKQAGYKQTDDAGNVIGARELTDEDCRAVVRQAEYLVVLSQQDLVAMLGGRGPGELVGGISSFASASTAEKMLAAMDINRWSFEKWINLKPGQLVIWQNACRLGAEVEGKIEVVDHKLKGVREGSDEFKKLVRQIFGGKEDGSEDKAVLTRVKKALEIREMERTGHFSEIHVKDLKDPREQDLMWKRLSADFLRDQMIAAEGEKILGGLLEVYDHFSSVWRISIHLDQMERIWGKSDQGGYGDLLGLGMRLRKVGYGYISAETPNKREAALVDLKKELAKIAKYRPQALFEFLSDGDDARAKDWFADGHFTGVFRGETINKPHQLHQAIARRFLAINELLAVNGLPPVDYAARPTPKQLKIVQTVCGQTNTNTRGYLKLMREMSGFVGGEDNINELTTKKNNRIYYRTQWLDDARLRYLEKITDVPDDRRPVEERVPLSQIFTDRGQGDVDALVRSWRDLGLAMKTVQNVFESLTPDEKTYLKNIIEINKNVAGYSGSEPYATRAVLYLLGGWGKTAKTDTIYDWLYLGGLDSTSAMKRLFDNRAPSLGLNGLVELIEQHDYDLLSKMEFLAPEAFREVEKYLGISTSVFGREMKLPLYLYRSRMYLAIAAILITIETGKQSSQALGAETGKSH